VEQVIARSVLLVLLCAEAEEERAYRAVLDLFAPQAEPEPPPGLRAPGETERHRKAAETYEEQIRLWTEAETRRRERLLAAADAYLARFPGGARRAAVLYLKGVVLFEAGRFAEARRDLEAFLALDPGAAEAEAARRALVQACRASGDYRAALGHAGADPEPDLLEEAGEVERAILAAEEHGDRAKAAGWRLLGTSFRDLPGAGFRDLPMPRGALAVVVEAGANLPPERRKALVAQFGAEKLGFLSCPAERKAVYVLDRGGVIRAVNPRMDTLHHRISQLAAASAR
jgi:tetratricopeptide (TPR) repeat protein